jgi:DNA-binding XRE family transcriptional regulator
MIGSSEHFLLQQQEEIEWFERTERGEIEAVNSPSGWGVHLIALRIHRGWTQAELARRLNVDRAVVSRDERNEYAGASLTKIQRVFETLGADCATRVWLAEQGVDTAGQTKLERRTATAQGPKDGSGSVRNGINLS